MSAAAPESIERRLDRLEDLERIRALFDAYRRALDAKDFRAYAALFAPDGVFVAGELEATGPERILALVEGMLGSLLTEQPGDDFHLVSNVAIELDGDRATATSTWSYVVRGSGDQPLLAKLGHYDDVLVRRPEGWRFARRDAGTDVPADGNRAVSDGRAT